jgi:hypothetical protein
MADGKDSSDKRLLWIKTPWSGWAIGGTHVSWKVQNLEVSQISALLPDSLYDLGISLKPPSFTFKAVTFRAVNGDRVNARVKLFLWELEEGDQVTLILNQNCWAGSELQKRNPVIYEIQ